MEASDATSLLEMMFIFELQNSVQLVSFISIVTQCKAFYRLQHATYS